MVLLRKQHNTDTARSPYSVNDDKHPTIIIAHATVGSGHRSAALGILSAFQKMQEEGEISSDLRFEVVDCLEATRFHVDGNAAASMFIGPTRPIYDLAWRYWLTGRLLWAGGTIWSRTMMPSFTEHVSKVKPLAVISTHICGANAAVGARMITKQNYSVICVPTDYEIEGMWPHEFTDLFCVGTEAMAETLRARKVEDDQIRVTGIPVNLDFPDKYSRDDICNKFGISPDKKIVLVMAGATLPKPYQRFRQTLDYALPYFHRYKNYHFVVLCGKDKEYHSHIDELIDLIGLDNVSAFDYVDNMAELMIVSDLAICKAGGLTVTECLDAKLPMILVGKSYGQEKVNVRMLTHSGCAYSVTTPRELSLVLERLDQHPRLAESMQYNEELISYPDAARSIVRATLEYSRNHGKSKKKGSTRKRFIKVYRGDKPSHVR